MDTLTALADHAIRRACGFAGLGIGTTMLALSFDLALALRTAGAMFAVLCLGLLASAWHAPRRNVRHSELWHLLPGTAAEFARTLSRGEAQRLITGIQRQRLIWHAERIGILAIGVWGLGLLAWLGRALGG